MNKYFALSLLLLSSSIVYGMEEKSCCSVVSCEQKSIKSDEQRELKKFAVDVDVELKLPEHFKNRLAADSKTKFTVNLEARHDAVAHPIFGLYLNKDRVVEAYAGKGEVGPSQHWINLAVDRSNDLHWVNIRLYSELKKRLINPDAQVSEPVVVAQFMSLKAATLKMSRVGDGLDIYDDTFKPDTIVVEVAAHSTGEGEALTEEELMAMNDDKLIHMNLDDVPLVEVMEVVSQEGREALSK